MENNISKALKVVLVHGECTVNGNYYLYFMPKISNKTFKDSDLKNDLSEGLKLMPSTVLAKIHGL